VTKEAKPGAKAKAKTEAKIDAKPEAKADARPEAKTDAKTDAKTETDAAPAAPTAGIPRKTWIIIGAIVVVVWAFAINTGNPIVLSVAGALTVLLAGVLLWALRTIRKHRSTVSLLQGAVASPEARREALAKLSEGKDAKSPTNVFARAQLLAADDDPQAALKLLGTIELKNYPPAMQDDVSLLQTQLYLRNGRTLDARKSADLMNLDNPQRKEIRPLAASLVAEAWARTGKPKEALALLDTIELPRKDGEQIGLQIRVARVFAKFAANQRGPARAELVALADDDINQLGRFIQPQFRVHPELQKLARTVIEQHPAARRHIKAQTRRR
jgi:outer membrane PBP1 activator LpoA protein